MPIQLGMISLGCAKNLVDDVTDADVVVINTCGFIEAAKQ